MTSKGIKSITGIGIKIIRNFEINIKREREIDLSHYGRNVYINTTIFNLINIY
jgi:hypothetical protein